jgi:predicted transposase/invertase (TIGR01784 family)
LKTAIDNPHDKRFKALFSNKKSFISLLTDCVKEPWVKDLDENTLVKSDRSFILQDFSEKEADIVYKAILNGQEIIFYILMELQSNVDYRMPYRLLLYIVEILRDYFNQADTNARDNKDFKFPVVFPIVFYSGSNSWTVPLSIKQMFDSPERFGSYVLDFDYMLLDAKGFDTKELKQFSSRLLAVILLLEKSKSNVEFYEGIRNSLDDVKTFDVEERRIFNLFIKIMDIAYGYNKSEEIKTLLDMNSVMEVDRMLTDVIENAKYEKEQLKLEGKLEGKLEDAKVMLLEKFPIDIIVRITKLPREKIENISVEHQ